MARTKALRRAQTGFRVVAAIQQHVHADLDIARSQQRPEPLEGGVFGVRRKWIAAPGFAHQPLGGSPVAAREQCARKHEPAFARDRLLAIEECEHSGIVALVVPQRGLPAPPEECHAGPSRVLGDECLVAVGGCAIVVAAQDHPFGQLARNGIGQRGLKLRGIGGLPLADELDDLLERLHVRLRGRRCAGQRQSH